MDDVRRRDLQAFARELFSPWLVLLAILVATSAVLLQADSYIVILPALTIHGLIAWKRSIPKRFRSRRFLLIWNSCEDRLARLHKAIRQLSRSKVARLEELPTNIQATSRHLYDAIRRADLVEHEVRKSEGWYLSQLQVPPKQAADLQARELNRIAETNLVEYRQNLAGVFAGIERTEAQSSVFITALDTLRVKMLGYRLAGKRVEEESSEFLVALTEAKMQLESIDKALEELELTPYPKQITVMPDSPLIPPTASSDAGGEESEVHEDA
jgi:hypothetical protein